jgi:Tfp pilus assembly protein PilF
MLLINQLRWSDPAAPTASLVKLKLLLFLALLLQGMTSSAAGRDLSEGYALRSVCATCHKAQAALWTGSHHDLAMQPATRETVLGDFNNASLTHFGVTSSFFVKDDNFMVRTGGADGKLADFHITYTFGVAPLQQYLVEFPGGRLQALGLAWDTRPAEAGGQRWFHLYPDERIAHDDVLHWTQASQNWNSMCAECHSTGLQKNYDAESRTFSTTWSEIDVACEACHGPGAEHVAWAGRSPELRKTDPGKGLVVRLDERRDVSWAINPETGNAERSRPRESEREIGMCARCHARRSPISRGYVHGEPLLDHYLPRRLDEGMYHADGQIDDEVYVYGSFVQSRMYHAGVTCSDCHEPHSLELRAPGNGVCLQCHAAAKYESAAHHFHKPGSPGGSCAECHMPPKTYMVVDPRHDHSMRIPRPDLSVTLGTPNACTNCHTDQGAEWAAAQVEKWYGKASQGYQRYAGVLAAVRREEATAGPALADLAQDAGAPGIARATALAGLGPYLGPSTINVVAEGLAGDDPARRVAALQALESAPLNIRAAMAFSALGDPVRAVRIEAARILAALSGSELAAGQQAQLDKGVAEYIEAQQVMAERPEAQVNLGNLYAVRGRPEQAARAYRTALAINPDFMPAYVNLADLYRSRGDESRAEEVLREAIKAAPGNGDVHHALGLSLVRQQRLEEAVAELELAARLSPEEARYVYVYAVALNSTGKPGQAILVLQGAHTRFPGNTDILSALVAFHRETGNTAAASTYADKLDALMSGQKSN